MYKLNNFTLKLIGIFLQISMVWFTVIALLHVMFALLDAA